MQVFLNKESMGTLSKTGNTTVQLSASVMTLGAKQYTTGNLVCDITTLGAGNNDKSTVTEITLEEVINSTETTDWT